jgi:hypothetical protein
LVPVGLSLSKPSPHLLFTDLEKKGFGRLTPNGVSVFSVERVLLSLTAMNADP